MSENVDCIVIGAGVVGLACAAALAAAGREVLVLEKEAGTGCETSSRNSEVIHAGIYYSPGSLKARLCRDGKERLYSYCSERRVPHRRLGKLIVAASHEQCAKLAIIEQNAVANGVTDLTWISMREMRVIEPELAGVGALRSPSTGIVDSRALMRALEADLATYGGMVALKTPVLRGSCLDRRIILNVGGEEPTSLVARSVINCAGLHAPLLAKRIEGLAADAIPNPFYAKGHYYHLSGQIPFKHLIYPVPEEGGLGVHLTLDLAGQARFGPDVTWTDAPDYSFDDSRRECFIAAVRSYYPALNPEQLYPAYTGIRPKLVGPGRGEQDFRIEGEAVHGVAGLVNLFGIESPGLTACLAIADHVVSLLQH